MNWHINILSRLREGTSNEKHYFAYFIFLLKGLRNVTVCNFKNLFPTKR